jgi:hypothetical protein
MAIAVLLAVTVLANDGFGMWRVLLDEHFDKDQRVPLLRWPWQTPPNNPNQRWHYNPYPPYYRYEAPFTFSTWGLQDYIFNSYIRQREEFPQSIWCAYTNYTDINNPFWPEDNDYQNNCNAWTWWGPFDLRRAVDAAVSFWYYVDVQYGLRDSLCVVVTDSVEKIGVSVDRNGRPTPMRTIPFYGLITDDSGRVSTTTFPHDLQDWQRREFHLDTLAMLDANGAIRNDTIPSLLGWRYCWLAFVWQTNDRGISGKGAFVDDVMVMWDDGLFDILTYTMDYGYPIDEENINWHPRYPRNNESVYFKLYWRALGNGEVGPFNIKLFIDNEEVYNEERTVIASTDTTYVTVADTLWAVTSGRHEIRWEVDSPFENGGQVEESDENNNTFISAFDVEWNPPPQFEILTPDEGRDSVAVNDFYRVAFTVSDSNETDQAFTIYIYWTQDTAGLAANPDLIFDYHQIGVDFAAAPGDSAFIWNLMNDYDAELIDTSEEVLIVGFAADGYPENMTYSTARGRVFTLPPLAVRDDHVALPERTGLVRTFPNPFNKSVSIEYSLMTAGKVSLKVFDLAGREVETLASGYEPAGIYKLNWSPENIGAGVYLLRLDVNGEVSLQKTIYTP